MNKRYFIYSYDEMYGGMYGMYDMLFFEGEFKEAVECAADMSYDVIYSYSFIIDELERSVEDGEYKIMDDAVTEDMAYEIYDLRDDAPSFEELRKMDYTPDEYIERFCVK